MSWKTALSWKALRRGAIAAGAALALAIGLAGMAGAQQVQTQGQLEIVNQPMPLPTILAIALVAAAAAAVNGLVGAILLFVIWMWLYGGVLPSIPLYLKQPANYPWSPHLLLPLIAFLLLWQYRLRGKIGPSWGLRHVVRQMTTRRSSGSLARS
jgi:hypothetical protein